MIRELGSTRLRNPESRKVHETNSGVFLEHDADFDYKISYVSEGDYWIVRDAQTGIFGHGENMSDALADFRLAVIQHLEVLEGEPALSEELSWQLEYLRARIQR